MEATSNAFWVYDIPSAYPAQVVVANPLKTRAIAEARIKTDALDAQILAKLLASDLFRPHGFHLKKNTNYDFITSS